MALVLAHELKRVKRYSIYARLTTGFLPYPGKLWGIILIRVLLYPLIPAHGVITVFKVNPNGVGPKV